MTVPPKGLGRLNINIDEQLHTAFKATAALQGERMTDLLIRFIEQYVREYMPSGPPRKGRHKK